MALAEVERQRPLRDETQSMFSASLIITSYNQEATLKLLLASLDRQTFTNFEVVIADDGSSDETANLCRQRRPFPIQFVTQEDLGYRKSKILNRAIHRAKSDYLIFLDADVIVERHFIQDHLDLRRPQHFVCGRRVDLGPQFSQSVTVSEVASGKFDQLRCDLLLSGIKKDSSAVKRAFRVKNPLIRKVLGYNRPIDILGSNFSAWKVDIQAVNGFNEVLESYWGEDGDLFIRLRNIARKPISAKSLCIQYHIYHHRRQPTQANVHAYESLLKNTNYKWAPRGYLESSSE